MDIIEWSVKTNGGGGEGWHRAPGGVEISGYALLDPPLSSPSLSLSVISLASRKEKKKEKRKKERKRERRKKKKEITKQRVARTSSPSSSLIIYSDGEPSPAGDVIRLRRQSERERKRERKKKKKEKMKTRVPRVAGEHVNNVLLSPPRFGWSESENEREKEKRHRVFCSSSKLIEKMDGDDTG